MTKALLVAFMTASLAAGQPGGAVEIIPIWPEGVPGAVPNPGPEIEEEPGRLTNVHVPTMTVFPAPAATRTGTAIVICPGGGYRRLAVSSEGTAVTAWLNRIGVTAFVLKYRVPGYGHPAPLRDALRAIRLVRRDAARWGIDPARVGIMGFSAGGHLAASAATLSEDPAGRTGAALDAVSARPDFHVLVYPVITMNAPFVHAGSRDYLLGKSPSQEQLDQLSLHLRVTPSTPVAFLVHGADDASVPVENSVLYFSALKKAGVPAELHAYAHGPHGSAMQPDIGPIALWPSRCEEWMRARGFLGPVRSPGSSLRPGSGRAGPGIDRAGT